MRNRIFEHEFYAAAPSLQSRDKNVLSGYVQAAVQSLQKQGMPIDDPKTLAHETSRLYLRETFGRRDPNLRDTVPTGGINRPKLDPMPGSRQQPKVENFVSFIKRDQKRRKIY